MIDEWMLAAVLFGVVMLCGALGAAWAVWGASLMGGRRPARPGQDGQLEVDAPRAGSSTRGTERWQRASSSR